MIVEVNDAGEILVSAELVQAAPHTRLKADREGDSVVLKPLAAKGKQRSLRPPNATMSTSWPYC
jgi:hypothetical protein